MNPGHVEAMPKLNSAARNFQTAIVISDYGKVIGGREKVAIDSAAGLAEAGVEVVFFCAVGPLDPRIEAAGIRSICLDLPDVREDVPTLGAALRSLWNADAERQLRALLDEYDPARTIIHAHSHIRHLSSAIGPVITSPGRRHVYTMHEYFLTCPNGGFFNHSRQELCYLRPMGPACLLTNCDRQNYLHKLYRVSRHTVAKARGGIPNDIRNIIYISNKQKEKVGPLFPAETKLHSVPNPITLTKTARVTAEENQNFVFVGRIVAEKGVTELAEVSLKSDLPVVYVGDGPATDEVRSINPDVRITGWISEEEVLEELRKARCLIFPSKWLECQPLTPFKAMAMGVPVICYDVSSATECITSGFNGEIVATESGAKGLLRSMEKYSDSDFTKTQSQNAYESYWSNPLTLEKHLDRLMDIYEDI